MGRPPIGKIAMTGAERTRLYRLKHATAKPKKPSAFTGTPAEIADNILETLRLEQARQVSTALAQRIAAIKPDCKACYGSGFVTVNYTAACGMPLYDGPSSALCACDCTPECQANPAYYVLTNAQKAERKAQRATRRAAKDKQLRRRQLAVAS